MPPRSGNISASSRPIEVGFEVVESPMSSPIDRDPSPRKLAEFAEFGMFALGMIAAPLAYFRGQVGVAGTFWVVAVGLRLIGWLRATWLRPIFVGVSTLTYPIGWVVSNAVLAILYYGVVTPFALVFRLVGRDGLNRRFDREAESYWEAYDTDRDAERYLRTF